MTAIWIEWGAISANAKVELGDVDMITAMGLKMD
jgi:hypothetical protein